ncbi:hypothetical protein BKA56DRAFT_607167 [Ilyonectria sp. MPI-CAGE-AT-0026]|nr:hypothetical protein BKA56DRAFT_607167 [Ilyonectria sp. MPI-CAGE-AT-0026]
MADGLLSLSLSLILPVCHSLIRSLTHMRTLMSLWADSGTACFDVIGTRAASSRLVPPRPASRRAEHLPLSHRATHDTSRTPVSLASGTSSQRPSRIYDVTFVGTRPQQDCFVQNKSRDVPISLAAIPARAFLLILDDFMPSSKPFPLPQIPHG